VTVRAAQIVSIVFHPLLLTTYLVLLLGQWMPAMLLVRQEHLLTFVAFIFGITFVLPALNVLVFRQFGVIGSLKLGTRQERILPFVFNSIVYLLIAVLFIYKVHLSTNFTKLMLIIAVLAVAGTVCTFFFKVSIHSLGWAGLVGIVLPLNNATNGTLLLPTAVLIVIAGVVMSARLKLNVHTPREVMVGGLAGFVIGIAGMNVLF
jgi:membrane-associated phospholipid phosphatase